MEYVHVVMVNLLNDTGNTAPLLDVPTILNADLPYNPKVWRIIVLQGNLLQLATPNYSTIYSKNGKGTMGGYSSNGLYKLKQKDSFCTLIIKF